MVIGKKIVKQKQEMVMKVDNIQKTLYLCDAIVKWMRHTDELSIKWQSILQLFLVHRKGKRRREEEMEREAGR